MDQVKKSRKRRKSFRKWLEAMPLRRALVVLMLLFIVAAVLCLLVSFAVISEGLSRIYREVAVRMEASGVSFEIMYSDPYVLYTPQEQMMQNIFLWASVLFPFLFSFLAAFATAAVFYRVKLKKPMAVLREGAEKIARNDLSFTLSAPNPDELGALCDSFETMRGALEENNRRMWRLMEEHKRLNAAFAHDLRTPLTVLRGYSDFLITYVPQGKVSGEKLLFTLSTMERHVERLERYVSDMNRVQSLEELEAKREPVEASAFAQKLLEGLKLLIEGKGLEAGLRCDVGEGTLLLDTRMVSEVAENLTANAIRYAKSRVALRVSRCGQTFLLTVEDDGEGFSEEALQQASKAFYKDAKSKEEGHFGLGLNICSLLCDKHAGRLTLENKAEGGARVTTAFAADKEKGGGAPAASA